VRFALPFIACLLSCNINASLTVSSVRADAGVKDDAEETMVSVPVISRRPLSRHVLIVGDSEACRVGYYVKETVRELNDESGQPRDVVDVDCMGSTTVQYWGIGGNLKLALSRHPNPDDVLVFLGTNHYWVREIPKKATKPGQLTLSDVKAVTDLLKNTNCVWVGNTSVSGKSWDVNELLRDAVTQQCLYFDTEAAGIPLEDGVHPGRAGAVKWLRLLWATIPPKYEEATP